MNAARLQQAQSEMRLERQPQAKGEVGQPISDLMTVKEAATYLRCSVSALYDQTRNRGRVRSLIPIPVIRIGKRMMFRRSSLDRWLEALEKAG
jgi:excisionase family DNA binding protein